MPQVIGNSPFDLGGRTVDNGPGPAIGSLGNVFSAFSPNPANLDAQLKAAQENRAAAASGQLGQIFAAHGAMDPNIARAYIANGGDVEQLGKALRLQGALNGGVDSDQAARAAVGIGAFNNTPLYQQRGEQAATARAVQQAQIQAASQIRQASLEPVAIQNADGSIGWTTKGAIAAGNQPKGAAPMMTPDQVKGAIEQRHILPDAGAPPMTDAQSQLVAPDTSKFELKQTGTDAMGNPTFSVFDPSKGAIVGPAAQAGAPQANAGPAPSAADPMGGLHGAEYLATLPPEMQPIVKAVAEGRALPPNMQSRGGKPSPLMMAVTQYDPSFDASNTQLRFNTRKDFSTAGKSGQTMALAGSALGHLNDVLDAMGQLGNLNSGIPGNNLVNAAKNAVIGSAGGDRAAPLNQYNEALQRFAGELDKFYTASGGTEAERKASEESLSPNKSPSELYAAASTLGKMLQTKVGQLEAQRNQILGTPTAADIGQFPVYGPDAQKALAALQALNDRYAKTGSWTGVTHAPGVTPQREMPIGRAAPKIGDVEDGHVYTGGDPGKKESWMVVPGVK